MTSTKLRPYKSLFFKNIFKSKLSKFSGLKRQKDTKHPKIYLAQLDVTEFSLNKLFENVEGVFHSIWENFEYKI